MARISHRACIVSIVALSQCLLTSGQSNPPPPVATGASAETWHTINYADLGLTPYHQGLYDWQPNYAVANYDPIASPFSGWNGSAMSRADFGSLGGYAMIDYSKSATTDFHGYYTYSESTYTQQIQITSPTYFDAGGIAYLSFSFHLGGTVERDASRPNVETTYQLRAIQYPPDNEPDSQMVLWGTPTADGTTTIDETAAWAIGSYTGGPVTYTVRLELFCDNLALNWPKAAGSGYATMDFANTAALTGIQVIDSATNNLLAEFDAGGKLVSGDPSFVMAVPEPASLGTLMMGVLLLHRRHQPSA